MATSHANGSLADLLAGSGTARTVALSGLEDHSVSVIGTDQIVTYDDSNVFIDRDGLINANTGDTDSSGLNAVDVVNSRVRSGNSGDGEGDGEDEEEVGGEEADGEEEEAEEADEEASQLTTGSVEGTRPTQASSAPQADAAGSPTTLPTNSPYATVTDEGASTATGPGAFVVGADGYDDVSIRSSGDRNIVTYDDSNVVIGGSGKVNAQIGDSDTGGAVVMGVYGSDVQAGCEGDLCYPD